MCAVIFPRVLSPVVEHYKPYHRESQNYPNDRVTHVRRCVMLCKFLVQLGVLATVINVARALELHARDCLRFDLEFSQIANYFEAKAYAEEAWEI